MTCSTLLRASLATALLALLTLPAAAQLPPPPSKPQPGDERNKDLTPFSQGLFLPTRPAVIQRLEAAQDYIATKKWEKAVVIVQSLLDAPEEVFVPFRRKGADGKDHFFWNSQRAEADQILGSLPPDALEFYRSAFAERARGLLQEARKERDPEKLALVAQRFLHTPAGREAAAALGAYHLDRGRPLSASLCFQRLLSLPGADRLPPVVLFQAALAGQRCGDQAGRERAWKLLSEAAPNGIEVGDKRLSLADLGRELDRAAPARAGSTADCLVYRGQPDRQGVAAAGVPVLEERWRSDADPDPLTRTWLDAAVRQLQGRNQPVLPALFPVAAGGKVFARTTRGVAAWDLAAGKILWESSSPVSLDSLAADSAAVPHVDRWINAYLSGSPELILENSVVGSLSSDGRFVYAVEDLPVPAYPSNYAGLLGKGGMGMELRYAGPLTDAVYHSRLVAVDAATGKVVWERGGRTAPAVPAAPGDQPAEEKATLDDSFLMAPPLPLGDKLYLLAERDQNIRLLCLNPESGEVIWVQPLATSRSRMVLDGGRRLHAAHLAYGNGVLVCPTNCGGVLALDLLSHSLLWAYAYREEPPPPPEPDPPGFGGGFRPRGRPRAVTAVPNLSADWRATAPVIAGDKVVFAAPDHAAVHCVSLRDGKPLWEVGRASGEQYLAAVQGGKVLVVGSPDCRLINLDDGKVLATVSTGQPSGQGVLAGSKYLLPLKSSAKGGQAGVCLIDLDKGEVEDFLPSDRVPGNLVIQEGVLLSQGLDGVTAYPLKAAKAEGGK